jgi:ribA/ribD-fused uncharacterized protein
MQMNEYFVTQKTARRSATRENGRTDMDASGVQRSEGTETDRLRAGQDVPAERERAVRQWRGPRNGESFFWSGHNTLGFLSNDYYSKFDVEGATFTSVDWYVWYCRAKAYQPRSNLAGLIREAKSREKAKQLSRKCTTRARGSTADWGTLRLKCMAKAVKRKFECSAELSRKLLLTGESALLYAAKYDGYFGIGLSMKEAVGRRDEWGENFLGQMLVLVRSRLRERGVA